MSSVNGFERVKFHKYPPVARYINIFSEISMLANVFNVRLGIPEASTTLTFVVDRVEPTM